MATATKHWTIGELHSLPDDGNKYELIRGVLYVTPAPTDPHETIGARLTRILDPYVAKHNLGWVYRPRAVVQFEDSEVEPDLMVRLPHPDEDDPNRATAPTPSLVIEIASRSTRLRDRNEKRAFYRDAGVPEYWAIDGENRKIIVFKSDSSESAPVETLSWHPTGATEPLTLLFDDIFGPLRGR